ncbi:MAG: hypothetical protein SPK68_04765 [Lachnospiraceae bacterium]|nr:hypothetical protein [Lachnospiraceae bacterium]
MNHILAVCDSEAEYSYGLADYLSTGKGFPFEVQAFTSLANLKEFAKKHPISIALVAQKDYEDRLRQLPIDHIILLREEKESLATEEKTLWKYQSCEKLMRELLEWIAEEGIMGRPIAGGKQMKLVGIYSPVGKCLKTSFSFVLGQLLGKKHKVLYLNLECYSGLGKLLKKEFTTDMSELLYYLQNTPERFAYRMGSMTERVGGLDILPPFGSFLDFVSVNKEEWIQFFREIERGSDYEYVILDLSDAIQGLFDILRLCNVIYTLGRTDGFAIAKIEQYREVLQKSSYEDIWKKTRQYTFPEIKNLPAGLQQLTYTELAEYARERMEEDFDEG